MAKILKTNDIQQEFIRKLCSNEFVTDKSGVDTLEIVGASFIADEESIFGSVNWDYVNREFAWYESLSLNVYDMPDGPNQAELGPPKIWQQVSDKDGFINSNYGWCIFSADNGQQYAHCLAALKENPDTRRAIMIYTRPSMQVDYNKNGMSDFMCTNTAQYLIRDDKLNAVVNMRSNDAVFGYKNDRAWQDYILHRLAEDLDIEVGNIYWQVGSLHVYQRHFHLVKS